MAQNVYRFGPSAVTLWRKRTDPSPKGRLTPSVGLLEKSSNPPSASVLMLIQLLWARIKHCGLPVVFVHGLVGPGRVTAPFGTPARRPLVWDQARSPTNTVVLVPSVMSVNRVLLLR